jgi:hypothetical protein
MESLIDLDEEEERNVKKITDKRQKLAPFTIEVHPETLRLVTYGLFWVMVVSAVIFFNTLVTGVDLTDTPLVRMFGYNNVCIFWDYTPSRELTAMIYPFVEYPLITYIVLSFVQIHRDYIAGDLPGWFYKYCQITLPVQIVLMAWFRMIFVVQAFENVVGHTLGFLGLQVALVLVAMQNAMYWTAHKDNLYIKRLGPKGTLIAAWTYVGAIALNTAIKLTLAISLFAGAPVLDLSTPLGATVAGTADRAWLLLCAIMPVISAYIQRRLEPGLTITIR